MTTYLIPLLAFVALCAFWAVFQLWLAKTDPEAAERGVAYEKSSFPWAASGRAQVLGRGEGLTKWIVGPETNRVLG